MLGIGSVGNLSNEDNGPECSLCINGVVYGADGYSDLAEGLSSVESR